MPNTRWPASLTVAKASGMAAASVHDMRILPDGSMLKVATFGRGMWELAITETGNSQPVVEIDSPAIIIATAGDTVNLDATVNDADGDVRKTAGEALLRRLGLEEYAEYTGTAARVALAQLSSPYKSLHQAARETLDRLRQQAESGTLPTGRVDAASTARRRSSSTIGFEM